MHQPPDLPKHRIRLSRKARRVLLRVAPGTGLEVVIPESAARTLPPSFIPELLCSKRAWIDKALARLDGYMAERNDCASPDYLPLNGGREVVLLALDPEGKAAFVRQWLKQEAARRFSPRLRALSQEHGLPFATLTFRLQKSRWGSCSGKKNISLNAFLLFLPEELADYVLLHELCHIRHMNHSEAYWKLVFSLDSGALAKDRTLNRAWRYVPAWLKPH
ncbi:M48 family metallopeptidase [Desulfovibrio sp. OttesenSCG-928-M16]|nr:M48 family metallopeptidase [Desulfovibrio sp. OttesenSCG-928-M16]